MWERTLIEGPDLWRVSKEGIHTSFKYAHINFWNYLFAFCSSFQLHGIQSFLLCLAHRKNISGWLRKSSCRSTVPEGRRQSSSLTVGLCCAVLLRDPSSVTVGRLLNAGEAGDKSRLWKAYVWETVPRLAPRSKVMRSSSLGWLLLT